jgi:GNAT superfamily N-acetyltransferase
VSLPPTHAPSTCEETADPALLEQVYALRARVWGAQVPTLEAAFPEGRWTDAHDAHGRHWVVREGAHVVAAVRLCLHAGAEALPDGALVARLASPPVGPLWGWNRLVVHPERRGQGLAHRLDAEVVRAVRASGHPLLGVVETGSRRHRAVEAWGLRAVGDALPYRPWGDAGPEKHATVMVGTPRAP